MMADRRPLCQKNYTTVFKCEVWERYPHKSIFQPAKMTSPTPERNVEGRGKIRVVANKGPFGKAKNPFGKWVKHYMQQGLAKGLANLGAIIGACISAFRVHWKDLASHKRVKACD